MEKIKENAFVKKIGFNTLVLLCVMVVLYILFAIATPLIKTNASFVSYSRIVSALNYAYFLGFLALGVTFVIATGGIDFSIGPVMFCSALISGYMLTLKGVPLPVCLLVSILVGTIFGIINGFLVAYAGLPSFITSMASMMIAKGVGSVFTKTQSVSWPQSSDANGWFRNLVKMKINGTDIPTGLIYLIIGAIICSIILNKTKAGSQIDGLPAFYSQRKTAKTEKNPGIVDANLKKRYNMVLKSIDRPGREACAIGSGGQRICQRK